MKKVLSILLATLLVALSLASCAQTKPEISGKLKIISTVFPGYDFAKQVCGDKAEVSILVPPGSESHSYEPTAQDIIRIGSCDLFIYGGGLSDSWVDGVLSSLDSPIATLKMMDCVDVYEEELKPGMTPVEEEEEEGEVEYDEHVWTSPKNAILITKAVSDKLVEISPENKADFEANCQSYVDKLTKLDSDFTEFFAGLNKKIMIFGDRFPLRYFVEEYGIEYHAAFPGCASETEPSAATIAFLTDKVKQENITTIFYIEFSNHKVADSIAEQTGAKTALFHTCHNVSQQDIDAGVSYYSIMEQNLDTLRGAMQ